MFEYMSKNTEKFVNVRVYYDLVAVCVKKKIVRIYCNSNGEKKIETKFIGDTTAFHCVTKKTALYAIVFHSVREAKKNYNISY